MTNMIQNKLQKEREYLERMAQVFGGRFENERSMMFASGRVCSEKIRIVKLDDKEYFTFMLECSRKSLNTDIIPVMVPVNAQNQSLRFVKQNTVLTMIGTFRSNDWTDDDDKHHLDVFFEAQYFEFSDYMIEEEFDRNIVILNGYICTKPTFKKTKKGRKITEYRLAVENKDGTTEYFPIIVWGSRASDVAERYHCGDKLSVLGRLQSREYHKKATGEDLIAYEVSSRFTLWLGPNHRKMKKNSKQPNCLNESAR